MSAASCLSFTIGTSEALSTWMRVTPCLMKAWAAQTPLNHPQHQQRNISLLRAVTATSSPAVTALAHCVYNLEHMCFSQDYNCLHYCTENTLSWTFFHWNRSISPMVINTEVSKECCNYHSEREHDFFDPSIQPSATTRMWCFRRGQWHCSSFVPFSLLTCNLNPKSGNPSHHNKGYCKSLKLS